MFYKFSPNPNCYSPIYHHKVIHISTQINQITEKTTIITAITLKAAHLTISNQSNEKIFIDRT